MDRLREILRKYWGYDEFRPLQREAIEAVVAGRDSVVVLPTGGGKSLCYQVPALDMPGLAVVVSPLVSLMKDQVDSLVACGAPAACVNSSLEFDQRRRVADEIRSGRLKLLYLSPERMMTEATLAFLAGTPLSFIAIDEAHCISDWGHDFRPEYRALRQLKERFPTIGVHAYTATATSRVRDDIAGQLALTDPEVLVGSFDRPNLCYRVERRSDRMRQIGGVLARHEGSAGIIYCLRRRDVDEMCAALQTAGVESLPYHAGMSDLDRRRNQDAFINDQVRIIVATVAFGMGIDKSDVRFVIHTGAPKSLEAYQQESGRAGRDALEAECCLFYSPADLIMWRRFHDQLPPEAIPAARANLAGIERYCAAVTCRHRAILEHFGQSAPDGSCGACDVCLGELKLIDDSLTVAQKIGSCVLRLKENFGGEYTTLVLVGSRDQKILERGHDRLSTWGILKEHDKRHVRDWVEQMVDQDFLEKAGEYSLLRVTQTGRRMLRGEVAPRLLKPAERSRRTGRSGSGRAESRAELDSWQGVDKPLFEALRAWRRQKAAERGVPPYVIFADVSLRDMARRRPSTPEDLLEVHGVGEKKRTLYGDEAIAIIARHCRGEPQQGVAAEPARRDGREPV